MKTRKEKIKRLVPILLVCAILIAGAYAFLTATGTKTNHFTLGNVDIEVQEPNWDPDDNTKIIPFHETEKDPQIENTGENDAYVFFKVEVPLVNVATSTVDDNTAKELFELQNLSDEWELIDTTDVTGKRTYIYVYGTDAAPTALPTGETTSAIFDSVKVIDFKNTESDPHPLAGMNENIVVTGYAIQASGDGIVGKTASQLWNLFPEEADIEIA